MNKRILLITLALVPSLALAQTSNSGLIIRDQSAPKGVLETTIAAPATGKVERNIEISRDIRDMHDTTGMDQYVVYTWTDANGVRGFTDDVRKAPRNARKRSVYSMPAAGDTYRYTADDVLHIEEK